MSSTLSSPYPDPLDNRVHFKLNTAKIHLDNLRRLEAIDGTLDSSNVRLQAEIEIDEMLYHLVGVKDALLQEINCELHLGFAREEVEISSINKELEQKLGVAAREDLTASISKMQSKKNHPLWLINELHNYSKHRAMIGMDIVVIADNNEIIKPSLIDPRTGKGMTDSKGKRIPVIDYLSGAYRNIERLQAIVRNRINHYRTNAVLFRQGFS